jgi:MFS superfamily sulfate permease-like transporter
MSMCMSASVVVVAMVVMATLAVTVTVAVIVSAALRLRHACQHARADPLQHVDNDQFAAPA